MASMSANSRRKRDELSVSSDYDSEIAVEHVVQHRRPARFARDAPFWRRSPVNFALDLMESTMHLRGLISAASSVALAACASPHTQRADEEVRSMPQLEVGRVYRAEDGRTTYRYAGDGKLEKWGLERYFIPDQPKK
jgi:hypothetical protein